LKENLFSSEHRFIAGSDVSYSSIGKETTAIAGIVFM
jgi:deoxyinosine 3'endonuclease (endonuclease V)